MGIDGSDLGRFSRRDFLAMSVSLIAAMSLGGVSGTGAGHAAENKFPEGRCGGEMKKRVLVTYASKYGSTGGVADAIGKELCSKDVGADVVLLKNVGNISSYQGVVIGSAIYMGKWMSEAADFVKKNRDMLRQVPVAYFLVCMTLSQPTEENRAKALSYMDLIIGAVPEVTPVGIGTFAGALDYGNLSWLNKKILKSKGMPEGDFRDWNVIRAWARKPIYTKFVG
ncbi:MAG TPA: flavodoxin domain-containing protein [Desulfobacteraceae bacterium]|nr:flavodoxin domain-containing protein [Desulfobacteraceae bacterium]HPJ67640.1 flavodoxin domain-containing protein [Desulfobacteraceae bacterium]HPQ29428.1 flavodoxin domain-containing protein [Desulfobacteraceae bacterium]